ncbi:hypothetical protein [Escherichia coli]|uniref:hypothetical protein n=1 Tax=Escherichia coli TaxID=562 RepID=UPI00235822FB|nr:hypothetical protein [Escherichia coli]MDC9036573.1 hypothetical protein [Escherichia coli]
MFGIIKLTIHTITGMWVSIVLFKLMTNGWSGFYFQCCVLSLVFLTVSWLLSGEWLAAKWHLNRSQFGIRIDHDLASISDHSLASQSITIWHASDH